MTHEQCTLQTDDFFEILTFAKNLPEVNWEEYFMSVWTLEFVYPPGKYPESLESKGVGLTWRNNVENLSREFWCWGCPSCVKTVGILVLHHQAILNYIWANYNNLTSKNGQNIWVGELFFVVYPICMMSNDGPFFLKSSLLRRKSHFTIFFPMGGPLAASRPYTTFGAPPCPSCWPHPAQHGAPKRRGAKAVALGRRIAKAAGGTSPEHLLGASGRWWDLRTISGRGVWVAKANGCYFWLDSFPKRGESTEKCEQSVLVTSDWRRSGKRTNQNTKSGNGIITHRIHVWYICLHLS